MNFFRIRRWASNPTIKATPVREISAMVEPPSWFCSTVDPVMMLLRMVALGIVSLDTDCKSINVLSGTGGALEG